MLVAQLLLRELGQRAPVFERHHLHEPGQELRPVLEDQPRALAAGVDFRRASLEGARFPECDLTDVLGVDGLRGAVLTHLQALQLAPRFAQQLGIVVSDVDE